MFAFRLLIVIFTAFVSYIVIFTGLLIIYWAFTVIAPIIGVPWTGIFSFIAIAYATYYGVTAYNKMED